MTQYPQPTVCDSHPGSSVVVRQRQGEGERDRFSLFSPPLIPLTSPPLILSAEAERCPYLCLYSSCTQHLLQTPINKHCYPPASSFYCLADWLAGCLAAWLAALLTGWHVINQRGNVLNFSKLSCVCPYISSKTDPGECVGVVCVCVCMCVCVYVPMKRYSPDMI